MARSRILLGAGLALTEALTIIVCAFASGWLYHLAALGEEPTIEYLAQLGVAIALFVLTPGVARQDYAVANYLDAKGYARRLFHIWNVAFVAAIVLGFMTKTSMVFSRGTVVIFYLSGFLALVGMRHMAVRMVQIASKTGLIQARRIFLVGTEKEVTDFATRHQPWNLGMEIAGVAILPEREESGTMLDEAVQRARIAGPDDIFILFGWGKKQTIDQAIDHFMTLPASIHLGSEPLLDRFSDLRIARIGTVSSVQVVRRPLSLGDVAVKRVFDTVTGLVALVLLAPVFALVAVAIKLDSSGPVFFRQRRYGFNQQPFRIWKFRTMSTMDDGVVVRQASANDPRITRVGRILRKWNLDELPQLINVLLGNMSLVGPRPHALAHDHEYERRIALYARRHNVKPGITGWAQVNGFRGETSTDEKMRSRVEHDLHYIDNWSILMDISIIIQTVLSPKAYRNAG
ncbi:MAG: exopolysaccharide biosynthesis polyprenyl glycosylphosphotransferase [Beijerinckiaceae bacterium]